MPRLTKEQLVARRSGLGATDIAKVIAGKGWDVWLDKIGFERDPKKVDVLREDAKEWGHIMEPIILLRYEKETGTQLLPGGTIHSLELPWAFATIDGKIIGQSAHVDAKLVGGRMMFGWKMEDDGIPDESRIQGEWQLFCTGHTRVDFACNLGGTSFRIYRIESDPELRRLVVERATAFWKLVTEHVEPRIDGTEAALEYLLAKYPRDVRPLRQAEPHENLIGLTAAHARGLVKRGEKQKSEQDNLLIAAIGDAAGIEGNGWKATNKVGKGGVRRYRFKAEGVEDDGDK